ncbi:isoprenylcysteine carboxylmethyltransferase family protein [Thalassospira sp.]|uniref:methyltransferase family protein n=1 Tax=Thalassospira sp. TaxID=1912094 RepID=UPI0027360723|nr:isoprenylcysteine carboxylmethyltransferase family protein [Thalassospira sp.]MDP2698692.1 isoprenylcysteine carboxylmethyltransferase family protein [Thalassospira sp.]
MTNPEPHAVPEMTAASVEDSVADSVPDSIPAIPPNNLQQVHRLRKYALRLGGVALFALIVFTQAYWHHSTAIHDMIRAVGFVAIAICIFGRGWCALYIGGRKKTELVTTGPYSICRNPLYMFSFIGAFGAGAQSGSILIACACLLVCVGVFRPVVLLEEKVLMQTFGRAYRVYCNTVPRFRPTWYRWRDVSDITCRPALFVRTVRDACWFVVAIPLCEAVKMAQDSGWIKPLVTLF